jgi:adenylate cyclase
MPRGWAGRPEDVHPLGVLYLESTEPSAFGGATEGLLRIIGAHAAAALAARGAHAAEEPRRAPATAPTPGGEPPIELVYYRADDTVLCNSAYIVKGAPRRILWSMLKAHAESGRTQFANRELRLDESLGLPAGSDNLEARLLVLRRRLADLDCGVTLERVGRGRLELRLERPAELTEMPTRLLQRS